MKFLQNAAPLALFAALQSPLFAAGTRLLAQASGTGAQNLQTMFSKLLFLVMSVGLIFGVIKVIQGAIALTQGESGWGQIIGGSMIAAAPTIMYFAFEAGGVADMAIKPVDIKK